MTPAVVVLEHAIASLQTYLIDQGVLPSEMQIWPAFGGLSVALAPNVETRLPDIYAGLKITRRIWPAR